MKKSYKHILKAKENVLCLMDFTNSGEVFSGGPHLLPSKHPSPLSVWSNTAVWFTNSKSSCHTEAEMRRREQLTGWACVWGNVGDAQASVILDLQKHFLKNKRKKIQSALWNGPVMKPTPKARQNPPHHCACLILSYWKLFSEVFHAKRGSIRFNVTFTHIQQKLYLQWWSAFLILPCDFIRSQLQTYPFLCKQKSYKLDLQIDYIAFLN